MVRGCSYLADENSTTWVFDAKDKILGRLSSQVAKILLDARRAGREERVIIVNAEQAIVSGTKTRVMATYRKKYELNHARKGPFFPRMPDKILKRTVRGMLPYQKNSTGRIALKRLHVEIGCPSNITADDLPDGHAWGDTTKIDRRPPEQFVRLGDISRELGAPARWNDGGAA